MTDASFPSDPPDPVSDYLPDFSSEDDDLPPRPFVEPTPHPGYEEPDRRIDFNTPAYLASGSGTARFPSSEPLTPEEEVQIPADLEPFLSAAPKIAGRALDHVNIGDVWPPTRAFPEYDIGLGGNHRRGTPSVVRKAQIAGIRNMRARRWLRSQEALRMFLAGYSMSQIATKLGVSDSKNLHRMIEYAIKVDRFRSYAARDVAVLRLEAMLKAIWDRATSSETTDMAVYREARRIITEIAKLEGAYPEQRLDITSGGKPIQSAAVLSVDAVTVINQTIESRVNEKVSALEEAMDVVDVVDVEAIEGETNHTDARDQRSLPAGPEDELGDPALAAPAVLPARPDGEPQTG